MEKDTKEFVTIPKEDFERMYKAIKEIIASLNLYYGDLKAIENTVNEIEKILKDALNPKILIKLEVIKELLDSLEYSLLVDYNNLKVYTNEILEKAKKEQIDKNQKDSKNIKDED